MKLTANRKKTLYLVDSEKDFELFLPSSLENDSFWLATKESSYWMLKKRQIKNIYYIGEFLDGKKRLRYHKMASQVSNKFALLKLSNRFFGQKAFDDLYGKKMFQMLSCYGFAKAVLINIKPEVFVYNASKMGGWLDWYAYGNENSIFGDAIANICFRKGVLVKRFRSFTKSFVLLRKRIWRFFKFHLESISIFSNRKIDNEIKVLIYNVHCDISYTLNLHKLLDKLATNPIKFGVISNVWREDYVTPSNVYRINNSFSLSVFDYLYFFWFVFGKFILNPTFYMGKMHHVWFRSSYYERLYFFYNSLFYIFFNSLKAKYFITESGIKCLVASEVFSFQSNPMVEAASVNSVVFVLYQHAYNLYNQGPAPSSFSCGDCVYMAKGSYYLEFCNSIGYKAVLSGVDFELPITNEMCKRQPSAIVIFLGGNIDFFDDLYVTEIPWFDLIFNYAVLLYDKFKLQVVIKGHPTWSNSDLFVKYQYNVPENQVCLDRSYWSKDKWVQPFIGIFPGTVSSTITNCISSCNSCLFIDELFPYIVKPNNVVYNIGLHVNEFDDSYVLLEQLLNDTEFRFATITAQLEELKLFADPSKDTVDIFAKEILSFVGVSS